MKGALIMGGVLGGIAGAPIGQGAGCAAGAIVGAVEGLIAMSLIRHFAKPAWDIVMATLKAILTSAVIAFFAWLWLMSVFQHA